MYIKKMNDIYYLKLNEDMLREILFDCIADCMNFAECSNTIRFEYSFDPNHSLFIKSISILDNDPTVSEKVYDSWFNDKFTVDEIENLCKQHSLNYSIIHLNEEIIKYLILKRSAKFKNGVPRKYYKEAVVEFFGEVARDLTCVILTSKNKIRQELCEYINANYDYSKHLKFKKAVEK